MNHPQLRAQEANIEFVVGHAVGAQLAQPGRVVIDVDGDGSLRMTSRASEGTIPAGRKIMNTIMMRPSAMCS